MAGALSATQLHPAENAAEDKGRRRTGSERVHRIVVVVGSDSVGNWGDIPRGKRAGDPGIWGESHGLAVLPFSQCSPGSESSPSRLSGRV